MKFAILILFLLLVGMDCAHSPMNPRQQTNYEFYCERVRLNKEIQQKLQVKGYYKGKIDGVLGNQTISAIRKLQKDRGIKSTGRLDSLTRQALNN